MCFPISHPSSKARCFLQTEVEMFLSSYRFCRSLSQVQHGWHSPFSLLLLQLLRSLEPPLRIPSSWLLIWKTIKAKQTSPGWYRHWSPAEEHLYLCTERFIQEWTNWIPALPLQTRAWSSFGGSALGLRHSWRLSSQGSPRCSGLWGMVGNGLCSACSNLLELKALGGSGTEDRTKLSPALLALQVQAGHQDTFPERWSLSWQILNAESCSWPKPMLAIVLLWVGGWTKMTSLQMSLPSNICSSMNHNSTLWGFFFKYQHLWQEKKDNSNNINSEDK